MSSKPVVPDLRQYLQPLTPKQVKARLEATGCTLTAWANANGYSRETVSRVLSGMHKGKYGKVHEIAVALGLKLSVAAERAA